MKKFTQLYNDIIMNEGNVKDIKSLAKKIAKDWLSLQGDTAVIYNDSKTQKLILKNLEKEGFEESYAGGDTVKYTKGDDGVLISFNNDKTKIILTLE